MSGNSIQLTPYLVTVGRDCPDLNYAALKEMGVVGAVIEAGRLYDVIHMRTDFANPNLDRQVRAAEAADLPIGLYIVATARNSAEAKDEVKQFVSVIRRYRPTLGYWFMLKLSGTQVGNDIVINAYHQQALKSGIASNIGLYADRKQLAKVSWDKHYSNWHLWLNDHLDSLEHLDKIVTPAMFNLDPADDVGAYVSPDVLGIGGE